MRSVAVLQPSNEDVEKFLGVGRAIQAAKNVASKIRPSAASASSAAPAAATTAAAPAAPAATAPAATAPAAATAAPAAPAATVTGQQTLDVGPVGQSTNPAAAAERYDARLAAINQERNAARTTEEIMADVSQANAQRKYGMQPQESFIGQQLDSSIQDKINQDAQAAVQEGMEEKVKPVKDAQAKQGKTDTLQNLAIVGGFAQGQQAQAATEKQAQEQATMEAAQRGREISSGTTTAKSDYFGDWVLDEPMLKAWNVLKARMEIGPHEERQDDLIQHLKNLSGQHSIRTNDDDNSFILDNVHDDDEDITRKLIQSFGRKFADGEPVTEKKPTKAPRYF